MLRQTSPRPRGRRSRRRGAILLVVLTMLALFAVIGLSFVLYAESEANASRIGKDAVNTDLSPPETSGAINAFLEQMIYQPDKQESALYGNELSRLIYGNALAQPDNAVPYSGVGVYSETLKMTFSGVPTSLHRTQVVRYGSIPGATGRFILPDQTYAADPATYDYTNAPTGLNLKYVSRAAPYTYADRNNIYVAVQDPATGRIVKPSYHAPSLFGPLDPSNPNWYTPQGYFQLLRPRTIDHLTTAEMTYLGTQSLWPIPTVITVYADRSFSFTTKTPPASFLIKKAAKLKSGSKEPGKISAGNIKRSQLAEIAEMKMKDLNANDIEAATRIIEGSARAMGLQVVEG